MSQLQAILKYQEIDTKLYTLERELASSEERKEYVKVKKFLETAPEKLDAMEVKANALKTEAAELIKKYEKMEETLQEFEHLDELVTVGADIAFALENAKISIMSPKSAVAFLENEKVAKKSREELEAEWAAENAAPVKAAIHGEIDDVIEASEARMRICAALSMLASKCCGAPARRHANLPL